ncbi:hypothetical protein ILUMI_04096, partial [Ignelater luminosus]
AQKCAIQGLLGAGTHSMKEIARLQRVHPSFVSRLAKKLKQGKCTFDQRPRKCGAKQKPQSEQIVKLSVRRCIIGLQALKQ